MSKQRSKLTTTGSNEEFQSEIQKMDHASLTAQEISQQGAIHAVSFLLKHGANEETAHEMLASLCKSAGHIRDEWHKRGWDPVFSADQTEFS